VGTFPFSLDLGVRLLGPKGRGGGSTLMNRGVIFFRCHQGGVGRAGGGALRNLPVRGDGVHRGER